MFLAALTIDGALAGVIYATIALAFVVVYKASRTINFALGEWVMLGSRMVATGLHAFGLGLGGALGLAIGGMVAVALGFNRLIMRPLIGRPTISLIMVTIGFGALVRGAATLGFGGISPSIALPIGQDPMTVMGVAVAPAKLIAAVAAVVSIAAVSWLYHGSRVGLALRALADDQQAATAVGIDAHHSLAIAWALLGVLSVLAGSLWTVVAGGGFGIVLVGLKVFPIVIIGGLDSIPGTVVGALAVGVLESLAAGYVDPVLGGGFSNIASYLVLIGVLFARPYGLFGEADIERV